MSLNNDQLRFYADYIEDHLGIVYKQDNYYQLSTRLEQVSVQLGFESVGQMDIRLKNGIFGHAKTLILDIATNNETLFFRDRGVFNGFKEFLNSENQFSGPPYERLKIWCGASSTGQEPYSLSFLLAEWKEKNPLRKYSILATDFSDRVLSYAKEGEYTQLEVQRGLKTKELIKYFEPSNNEQSSDTWKIKDAYRSGLEFDQLNLLKAWPHIDTFDFVFLRNVLIYFEVDVKKKIVEKVLTKLRPGGHLVLGSSESLVGISDDYGSVKYGTASFYQKKSEDVKLAG